MANLLITTGCQRRCSYCFAQGDKNNGMVMTWDNFMQALNFIASGPRALNILGGEPTLHPEFDHMLAFLLENDFVVQVFTNGMVNPVMLDKITAVLNRIALRENQLRFAVNVNEEKYRTEEEDLLQRNFLDSMGPLAYLAFTIHEKTNLMWLQDMVQQYYLEPAIRLGLAMPIKGVDNKYLPLSEYKNVSGSILELARNSPGTTITFDCGFPLCMFELEDLSEFAQNDENDFSFICGVPLDIYPDLTVTNCYPLSKLFKCNIKAFGDIMEAYKFFEEGFYRPDGIYGKQCVECKFFRRSCLGGCKGFSNPEDK